MAGISSSNGTWSRNITDLAGNLAEAETAASIAGATLQLVNLHGDVVATAPDSSSDVGYSTYSEDTEFGAPRASATGTQSQYAWLGGKERSSNALGGTVLMGERVYDPILGRFLSIDRVPGGSANRYDYCNQDPINCLDLRGDSAKKKARKIAKSIIQGFSVDNIGDAIVDLANGRLRKAAKDIGLSNLAQFADGILTGKISAELAKQVGKDLLKDALKAADVTLGIPVAIIATLLDDLFYRGGGKTVIEAPGPFRIPGLPGSGARGGSGETVA